MVLYFCTNVSKYREDSADCVSVRKSVSLPGSKRKRLHEYKDLIGQLNTTIAAQTELIRALKQELEADRAENQILQEKIDYLTQKIFDTSSEKIKEVDG